MRPRNLALALIALRRASDVEFESLLERVGELKGSGLLPDEEAFLRSLAVPERMRGVTFSRVADLGELERVIRESAQSLGNVVGGEAHVYRVMAIERAVPPAESDTEIDESLLTSLDPRVRQMWLDAVRELVRSHRARKHVHVFALPITVDRATLLFRIDPVINRIILRGVPGEIDTVVVISCSVPRATTQDAP